MDPPHDEQDQEVEDLKQSVQELTRRLVGFDRLRDEIFLILKGNLQPNGFIDQLNTVERVFDCKDVLENNEVKIIAIKLKQGAFAKMKKKLNEKMKKKLNEKYLLEKYLQYLYQKMHVFHQVDRSVDRYTYEFHLLTAHSDVCYVNRLHQSIQDAVVLQWYWTLYEVYNLSANASDGGNRAIAHGGDFKRKGSMMDSLGQQKVVLGVGRLKRGASSNIKYYKYPGIGHVSSQCPNCKFINLSKEFYNEDNKHSFEGDPIYDEQVDEEDQEVTCSDHEEALVIRRSMITPREVDEADWVINKCFNRRSNRICKRLPLSYARSPTNETTTKKSNP
ncbi:hypothetical protein AMTRI_Chr08g205130 [Amborella trichopoda]